MKYIATRPRAERHGEHGLFGESMQVDLDAAMRELEAHRGNTWTVIYSLRREDASRLGYDKAESWQRLLIEQEAVFAEALNLSPEHLHWYAVFHDEGHHPHIHLMLWSDGPKEAYLQRIIRCHSEELCSEESYHFLQNPERILRWRSG